MQKGKLSKFNTPSPNSSPLASEPLKQDLGAPQPSSLHPATPVLLSPSASGEMPPKDPSFARHGVRRLAIGLLGLWAVFFPLCLSQDKESMLGLVNSFEAQLRQHLEDHKDDAETPPTVPDIAEQQTETTRADSAATAAEEVAAAVAAGGGGGGGGGEARTRTMTTAAGTTSEAATGHPEGQDTTPLSLSPRPRVDPLPNWQPWQLPPPLQRLFPAPGAATLDPSKFRLHIKLLTFDRASVTQRFLDSLSKVEFLGDTVSLEIFIDHPHTSWPEWSHKSPTDRADAMGAYKNVLHCVESFSWPHGTKTIHARVQNSGVQPQWVEAWWPDTVNDFAFIAEDDMEVSPLIYAYFKHLVMFYYYNQSNFDPSVFGISLFRQRQVAGVNGSRYIQPIQPFLYQLIGTWGQFLFPIQWKDFRHWYTDTRFGTGPSPGLIDPTFQKMITVKWWRRAGNHIWTPWHIRWAYVKHMYNLYHGFPGRLALARSHRTAGVSFRRTMGPDAELVDCQNLFEEHKDFYQKPVPTGPKPDRPLTPKDVATLPPEKLPPWWTATPGPDAIPKFDWCFRRVPNRRTPVRTLEELKEELPKFGAEASLAVIPLPSTRDTYPLVKNWLCFADGHNLHNYLLLLTLLPAKTSPQVDAKLAPACLQSAAQANGQAWRIGQDLAARGHLVYLAPPNESAELTPADCEGPTAITVRRASSVLLSAAQANVVSELVALGKNILVNTLGALWMGNPFTCVPLAASLAAGDSPIVAWGLGRETGQETQFGVDSLVIWIKGGEAGSQVMNTLVERLSTSGTPDLGFLHGDSFAEVQRALHLQLVGDKETTSSACVVSSLPQVDKRPRILLTRNSYLQLQNMSMWQVEDMFFACKELNCRRSP